MIQNVKIGTLSLDVPEFAIGKRKALVPKIMRHLQALRKAVTDPENVVIEEKDYDLMIDIIASTGLVERGVVENLVADDGDLYNAIRVIGEQCGLKAVKTGEV